MNTMVKLENISRKGNTITCDVFVEDCKEAVSLVLHTTDGAIEAGTLPEGYEWCGTHLWKAKNALKEIAETNLDEKRRTIMWY